MRLLNRRAGDRGAVAFKRAIYHPEPGNYCTYFSLVPRHYFGKDDTGVLEVYRLGGEVGIPAIGTPYDAAWVKWDTKDIKVKTTVAAIGILSQLYKERAESELSKQAKVLAQMIKSQVFPSYYLVEKEKGFVSANAKKLDWKKSEFATKLFGDIASEVARKKLPAQHTVTVLNPLCFTGPLGAGESTVVYISFEVQMEINVEVYYARLKK